MPRIPVQSSHLTAIGYDRESQVLEVEFKNGEVYTYRDFPPQAYETLMAAPSKGKHFNAQVKPYYFANPR